MPTPLDRNAAEPLWAQLEADLRRRLLAGEFDDRFPTDLELTRRYEVSRHTVREAIARLNKDGLLRRERGRGTVVDRAEFEQRLGALYSLFASIEATGVEQRSEVLFRGEVTDAEAAAALRLDASEPLVRIDRVRYAGEAPLAVDRAWLPAEVGRPLLDVDFSHTALYDRLDAVGTRPDRGWERITPVVPSEEERAQLDLEPGQACFCLHRLGCRGDEPIEWRVTMIRGDRYRFVADWSAGDRTDVRLTPVD